jgi:hypothetical protein
MTQGERLLLERLPVSIVEERYFDEYTSDYH